MIQTWEAQLGHPLRWPLRLPLSRPSSSLLQNSSLRRWRPDFYPLSFHHLSLCCSQYWNPRCCSLHDELICSKCCSRSFQCCFCCHRLKWSWLAWDRPLFMPPCSLMWTVSLVAGTLTRSFATGAFATSIRYTAFVSFAFVSRFPWPCSLKWAFGYRLGHRGRRGHP